MKWNNFCTSHKVFLHRNIANVACWTQAWSDFLSDILFYFHFNLKYSPAKRRLVLLFNVLRIDVVRFKFYVLLIDAVLEKTKGQWLPVGITIKVAVNLNSKLNSVCNIGNSEILFWYHCKKYLSEKLRWRNIRLWLRY